MRLNSWLTDVYFQIQHSFSRRAQRRPRNASTSNFAVLEQLESRKLLTVAAATVGTETRVNTYTPGAQKNPEIATDSAGDYVVTWESGYQDGSGFGIYAQRYNAAGVAQGSEFQVNNYTTNHQQYPSVAMDSAGDFVITWQSFYEEGGVGVGYGVYAQRFDSAGTEQGAEFRVNTYTTGSQGHPSVAMDSAGDFVVAWQTLNQDGSGYGVYAQRYSSTGATQGTEFRVNTFTTGFQLNPSVAMDSAGSFVIAWTSNNEDGNTYGVYAQRYNSAGIAQGTEFLVNTYTTNAQISPQVAMDSVGDFVITWGSNSQDGSGMGIYAQRYNAAGVAQGVEFKVNTYTTNSQANPTISMDSAGDFVITWQSSIQDGSGYGIYAQQFNAAGTAIGNEFRVNTFTTSDQLTPVVAMDSGGDFVVAWDSIAEDGAIDGIYAQRYSAMVGPIVTDVLAGSGPVVMQAGLTLTTSISSFSVEFSENMNVVPGGANSVVNRSNWLLMRYGVDVSYLISGITFGFNTSVNRYVAVVSFTIPLTQGGYEFIARQAIQDSNGNGLDGEADKVPGGDYRLNFYVSQTSASGSETKVNTYTTGSQGLPAVATDQAGDYVVVWESNGQDGDGYGIYAQRFNAAGVAQGSEFRVNTYTTSDQNFPSVGMDASGNFVIAWDSNTEDGDGVGVFAQCYNAAGVAQGGEFQVNTTSTGEQLFPSVAVGASGAFVIAWEDSGEDGSSYGIFAQQYNAAAIAQGGEFQVNTHTTGAQVHPSAAMDAAGDYVIAWESNGQDGSGYGIYAQRYNSLGVSQGIEFRVNTYTTGAQLHPSVAVDAVGDFVITWDSNGEDGSNYGVYAQRYNSAGFPQGGEFLVNTYTTGAQDDPVVAMDAVGDFVITWQSNAEDGSAYGVYAQRYDAAGTAQGSEFRLNTYTTGPQSIPCVAMDPEGDFVIAWYSNQDGGGYGVYAQQYHADIAPLLSQIESTPLSAVGSLSTPVTATLLASDANRTTWTGATIQIAINYRSGEDILGFTNTPNITGSWNASTGTLTLTGTDTVSDYRIALRNVTYHDTSATPNTAPTRTIDFQASDGFMLSNVVSRDVTVQTSLAPAVLSGVGGTGTYDENDPPLAIGANLVITDPNTVNLISATVSFTNWQAEDRVNFNNIFALQHTFSQNLSNHTASLTITGTDAVYDYQVLLRSVVYSDVSDNPVTTPRIASFVVNDGVSNSNSVSRTTNIVSVNDAPVLSGIETTPLAYIANDPAAPPQPISATLLVSDPDSSNCSKATVQITAGYENDANGKDVLSFVNQLGITGSWNATTGTLTLTGVSGVGNYRTALRSVMFSSSGSSVSTANRTLTIIATDDSGSATATGLPITRTVTVSTADLPPALTGIPTTSLAYVRGAAAVAIAPALDVYDPDSINLAGATIQVTGNYQNGQDVLAVTNGSGITGAFNASMGTLTLSGVASLASYQSVLRTVTYKTNTNAASTSTRTITWILNDGLASSDAVSRTVTPS